MGNPDDNISYEGYQPIVDGDPFVTTQQLEHLLMFLKAHKDRALNDVSDGTRNRVAVLADQFLKLAQRDRVDELKGLRIRFHFPFPKNKFIDTDRLNRYRLSFDLETGRFYTDDSSTDAQKLVDLVNRMPAITTQFAYANEALTSVFSSPPAANYDIDSQSLVFTGTINPTKSAVKFLCSFMNILKGRGRLEIV